MIPTIDALLLPLWLLSAIPDSGQLASALPSEPAQTRSAHGYTRNVAVLVFDGVELLDFAGPVEALSVASGWDRPFRVYTVGPERAPVRSNNVVTVVPDFAAAECPRPDILVIPGGETRCLDGDTPLGRLIRENVPRAEIVFSVCNGVFCLAEGGFLDGLEATTFHSSIGWLRQAAPDTVVRSGVRFVDNGHIVTAAGVSAGIDGALHLIDRLLGPAAARKAAQRMEYEWSAAPPQLTPPTDRLDRARQAWYAADWKAAEPDYAALAAADPDDAVALARWGTCMLFGGKHIEALEPLQRAAQLGSADARLHAALALAFERAGRREEALAAWLRSIDLDPADPGPHQAVGSALYDAGRFREAIPYLARAWSGFVGGSNTILMLAHAELEADDREGALRSLEEALATGGPELTATLAEARFDPLRDEPRFTALLARAAQIAAER